MKAPIRVLIADDHSVVREGLAAMIARRADMQLVAEAADGLQAVQLSRAQRPDVILIDLHISGLGGVDAIAQICSDRPQVRVIVLTTYDDDPDIYSALRAGAAAYLLKDTPREQLLDTIRAVYAGQRRIPPDVAA